jgi:hypothetical protein
MVLLVQPHEPPEQIEALCQQLLDQGMSAKVVDIIKQELSTNPQYGLNEAEYRQYLVDLVEDAHAAGGEWLSDIGREKREKALGRTPPFTSNQARFMGYMQQFIEAADTQEKRTQWQELLELGKTYPQIADDFIRLHDNGKQHT